MSDLRTEVRRALANDTALEKLTRRNRARCQAITYYGKQCTSEACPSKPYCGKHFASQFARAKAGAPCPPHTGATP